MTTSLFISLLTGFAVLNSMVTEVIKELFARFNKKPSANMIALINALILGGFGTVAIYLILNIPFNLENIMAIVGMILTTGLGSMIGYDKLIQLIEQIKNVIPTEEEK